MNIEVLASPDAVAQNAAEFIAAEARTAVAARGRFVIAVSGGHTPWVMPRNLGTEDVPWKQMHVVPVDERIAPSGDPDRNLTHLARESSRTRSAICANKMKGVRTALIHDHFSAKQGVEDDPMNILCMGGRTVGPCVAGDLARTFLEATYNSDERHLRRLGKVAAVGATSTQRNLASPAN